MNATTHEPCYGGLFPPSLRGEAKGKVFSLQFVTPAGMAPRATRPVLDLETWDACTHCPEFENCYKLSMAKLAIAEATGSR
jgi:hypothetical protein